MFVICHSAVCQFWLAKNDRHGTHVLDSPQNVKPQIDDTIRYGFRVQLCCMSE